MTRENYRPENYRQKKYPCMILCAGTSRRFGSNKMLALLAGRPLLAHTIERVQSQVSNLALNGDAGKYDQFGLPVLPDVIAGKLGPLAGILTAMEWAADLGRERVLTVSGDTPFVPDCLAGMLVKTLALSPSEDPVLPQVGVQRHQVCGLWPVGEAPNLRSFLRDGKSYKVRDFLTSYDPMTVIFSPENEVDPFFNVNTRADLETAERIFARK